MLINELRLYYRVWVGSALTICQIKKHSIKFRVCECRDLHLTEKYKTLGISKYSSVPEPRSKSTYDRLLLYYYKHKTIS
jgi:hypothetical protein